MLGTSTAGSLANSDHASATSTNLQTYNTSSKRRRISASSSELCSFKIFPSPHSPLDRPINAYGHFTIPRALLPLSFLDPTNSPSVLPSTRLFSAEIECLEEPHTTAFGQQEQFGTRVLISKLEGDQSPYAIERASRGVYSVCKLASWIDVQALRKSASVQLPRILSAHHAPKIKTVNNCWWTSSAISRAENMQELKRKNICGNSIGNRISEGHSQAPTPTPRTTTPLPEVWDPNTRYSNLVDVPIDTEACHQSPHEIKTNLTKQYLDALYLSNTSLAYFAKGPLSRARASFNGTGTLNVLSGLLNSLVLTIPTADKRYKTTLPNVIKASAISCDNTTHGSKKNVKPKASKNSLFPDEVDFIVSWWQSDDHQGLFFNTNDFEKLIAERISRLRFRETLLQLILLLEVLSIDSIMPTSGTPITSRESSDAQANDKIPIERKRTATARPKRQKNARKQIDVLIDRVTIWQSVGQVDALDKDSEVRSAAKTINTGQSNEAFDELKDFCSQVVIPFYGARLSNTVNGLIQKLGLPSTVSPARRPTSLTNPTARVAPGTELPRQKPHKLQDTLPHVLDKSSGGTAAESAHASGDCSAKIERTARAPANFRPAERRNQSRSKSTNHALDLRISTSTSHSVNRTREKSRPLSRSNSINQTNQSLKQREVDFSAIGKFYQAKLKKKMEVEQELKDAISALKKPNRNLAGREFMEAAHERASTSKVPKVLRLERKGGNTGVEVNATPKRGDKKSVISGLFPDIVTGPLDVSANGAPPSRLRIPGSTHRLTGSSEAKPGSMVSSTPLNNAGTAPVCETPSRGNEKTAWRLQALQESSLRTDAGAVLQTPSKAPSTGLRGPAKKSRSRSPSVRYSAGIESEESRAEPSTTASMGVSHDGNLLRPAAKLNSNDEPRSIYQALGWDENDIDELM